MKILLIEDSADHILLFKAKTKPWEVFVVETLDDAEKVLKKEAITLIFCDGYLPKNTGPDMLPALLKYNVPIIAHSSCDKMNSAMLALGAKATLNKKNLFHQRFLDFVINCRDLFSTPRAM